MLVTSGEYIKTYDTVNNRTDKYPRLDCGLAVFSMLTMAIECVENLVYTS